MKSPASLLRRPLFGRIALVLYVACVVGLIGAYMGVSNLDVRNALYVQGADRLEAGRPHALRGALLDAPSGQFARGAELTVELVEGPGDPDAAPQVPDTKGRTALIGRGQARDAGLAHFHVEPPADWPEGPHRLVVRATHPAQGTFEEVRPVEIVRPVPEAEPAARRWPHQTHRDGLDAGRRRTKASKPEGEPAVRIDVLPPDGELVRGLPGAVYLRTSDATTGRPLSTTVRLTPLKGLVEGEVPGELRTDGLGLARVSLVPVTDQTWKAEVALDEAEPSRAELYLRTVPAQAAMHLAARTVVPGGAVEGQVHSLFDSGGFYVDLYGDARWLDARAFGLSPGVSGFRVEAPPAGPAPLFYRVQLYQNLFSASSAWDAALVAHVRDSSTDALRDTARALLTYVAANTAVETSNTPADPYFTALLDPQVFDLGAASRADLERLIEASLLAIPREFTPPPLLANTQHRDREALEAWKLELKGALGIYTVLVLVAGLVVLLYFVFQGILRAREQSRLLREVDLEFAADDADGASLAEQQNAERLETVAVVLQGAVALSAIVLFGLGILMLLSYL